MKKHLITSFLLFVSVCLYAQVRDFSHSDYVCIGNKVNVRTGPGLNYSVIMREDGTKMQLNKGEGKTNFYEDNPLPTTYNSYIFYEGEKKNGFIKIFHFWFGFETTGWVSEQYLRPVCPSCKGVKTYRTMDSQRPVTICKKCHGRGY